MRPSGTPRHTSFEEYDLASNGSEADTSRLDLYRNPAPNLSFMDEPEGLLFGGLSVSMKSDSLRNLNIVSQGPPLPQELRSPSTHQALHPMQDPMYTEENHRAHRPQSMSNLRSAPPPPSLMGGSVDSPQMPYHPASVNSSPRINGVHYPSPSMGHQSPAGMMPPPPPSPQMVEMNRYPAPRPTPFDGGGRYNIQVPDDFAAYSHVFQHQQQHQQPFAQMQPPPRMMGGGGGLYHVTPPMQYSPPPTYSNTPPLSYRPTPRFVPPLVENHNLHYRPNREQQIANLAKAKLQAESKSATTSAESSPMTSLKELPPFTSSSSSSVASPVVSLSSSVPPVTPGSAVSGVSGSNLAASGAAAGAGGGMSVKSASPPPTSFSPQVDQRKAAVDKKDIVVYMVKLKVSCMYCIASNANLRLSLNDYVVVAVEGGEDVGVIGSCLSLSYFMDNFDLTNEEETLMAMKCIVRLASEKEKNDVAVNAKEEARLVEVISELNRTAFQFPITIMDTEYQIDRKKLTIYYDTLEIGATIDIKELLRGVYPIVQTKVSCKKVTSKPSKSGSGSVGGGGVSRTNSFKL